MVIGNFTGSPTTAGIYTVQIQSTDCNGVTETKDFTWTINATGCSVTAAFSHSTNGLEVTVTDQSGGVDSILTQVDFDDGTVITQTSGTTFVHTYSVAGTYNICVTSGQDDGGSVSSTCSNQNCTDVTVAEIEYCLNILPTNN